MSVSAELLCSFELLKPLDSSALKNHIKKGRNKRNSLVNSPVSIKSSRLHLRFSNTKGSLPWSRLRASEGSITLRRQKRYEC